MDQKTAATPPRLRRAATVATLLLAFGALTACGTESTTSPSGAASSEVAASPSNPDPRPSAPPSAPPKPSAEPTPSETSPGIAVGEPDPTGKLPGESYWVDGLRLTVVFSGGICEKYGLKVSETKPGTVLARVVVTEPQKPGTMCAAVAQRQQVSADLNAPLADRKVVDENTGQLLPQAQSPDPAGGPKH